MKQIQKFQIINLSYIIMDYKTKYLKYKTKYLNIKSGGSNLLSIQSYYNELINNVKDIFFTMEHTCSYEDYEKLDLNNLNIINTLDNITKIYKTHKYLELRPYKDEKVLIIGCGNDRLDNGNCMPKDTTQQDIYNTYHLHKNTYTIDMELLSNPSIVSIFDKDSTYKTIPDNSFDFIIFEGGGYPYDNPKEIERLLNKNNLSFCIYSSPNGYNIYSYYQRGIYTNFNIKYEQGEWV